MSEENPGQVPERHGQGPTWQPPPKLSAEQRRYQLSQVLGQWVNAGARIESQNEFQAVVVIGKPVNHILHLLITMFTCGAWAIVWIILALTQKETRSMLLVDEYGQIQRR